MKIVRVGVLGGRRGKTMVKWCVYNKNAVQVVAICDKSDEALAKCSQFLLENSYDCALYKDLDEFLAHDMDAVILANFANEHAPIAIRCMESGKHVYSEVLPCANMKEAVELVECVERTGKVYAYGENCCYLPSLIEMKKLYKQGVIGEFEYGEGEYVHDCESIWHTITYGQRNHWRNLMSAFFYCTHSAGPIIHATGLRPVKVVGFELPYAQRHRDMGATNSGAAVEMVTMENGGVFKSLHFNLKGSNTWFNMYGSKGKMETQREDIDKYSTQWLYRWSENEDKTTDYAFYRPNVDGEPFEGKFGTKGKSEYTAIADAGADPKQVFGHDGSDHYCMDNFIKAVRGDAADIIDVYEALDMFFVGHFGYLSVLDGNIPKVIPNFRNKEEREIYRNDTSCTFPDKAGDMLLPLVNGCNDLPDEVYENVKKKYEDSLKK